MRYAPLALVLLVACKHDTHLHVDTTTSGGGTGDGVPDIVVTPLSVDFGTVDVGAEVDDLVHIENQGDGDLLLDDLTFEDVDVPVTATLLGIPELAAGDSVDVSLAYQPVVTGSFATTLHVDSNDPDQPTVDVALTADVPSPQIEVDPVYYDFGTVDNGVRQTVTLEVRNVGLSDLHVTGYAYHTTSIELAVQDDGGLGSGATIPAGTSRYVTIAYTASDDVSDEGDLHLYSDDPVAWDYVATQVGVGKKPSSGSIDYNVDVGLTCDDQWEAYMDGVPFTAPYWNTWSTPDTVSFTLSSGDHVLAVHGQDVYKLIAGFLAAVSVDGTVTYTTGTSDFLFSGTNPGAGWEDPAYSDATWTLSKRCVDTSPWGGQPASLVSTGAEWIWDNADCKTLGDAWFRLHIRLP